MQYWISHFLSCGIERAASIGPFPTYKEAVKEGLRRYSGEMRGFEGFHILSAAEDGSYPTDKGLSTRCRIGVGSEDSDEPHIEKFEKLSVEQKLRVLLSEEKIPGFDHLSLWVLPEGSKPSPSKKFGVLERPDGCGSARSYTCPFLFSEKDKARLGELLDEFVSKLEVTPAKRYAWLHAFQPGKVVHLTYSMEGENQFHSVWEYRNEKNAWKCLEESKEEGQAACYVRQHNEEYTLVGFVNSTPEFWKKQLVFLNEDL